MNGWQWGEDRDEGRERTGSLRFDPRHPLLRDASNVLVLAPRGDEGDHEACTTLLTVRDPDEENVLYVTSGGLPEDQLRRWKVEVGEPPANVTVVSAGDGRRSSASGRTAVETDVGTVTVRTIEDADDLVRLGVSVSDILAEWIEDGNTTVVCFRSLTTLLGLVGFERVFRFLHVLFGQVRDVNAVAHYHLDPSIHDEATVDKLRQLFDAVVEITEDGEVAVS